MIECSGPNPVPIQFISLGATAVSCMTLDIYDDVSEDIVVWSVNFDLYTMGTLSSPLMSNPMIHMQWFMGIWPDTWVNIRKMLKINLTQFALWHNHEVRTIDACINSIFRHWCFPECERSSSLIRLSISHLQPKVPVYKAWSVTLKHCPS